MNTEELLDRLAELFEEGWRMPLSNGRVVVDALEATELIKEIRNGLPSEIEQARQIVADRKEIMAEAKREAEVRLKNAEEKAQFLVSREEVVSAATREASEVMMEAKRQANELLKQTTEQASEHLAMANKQANDLITETNNRAKELRTQTNEYVESLLTTVEKSLVQATADVRHAQQNYKSVRM